MYILGISCYYHDASACLLHDGEIIAAVSEERFSRIKHDSSFPYQSINFCLNQVNIKGSRLDYVVFHEKPFLKLERLTKSIFATYPRSYTLFREFISGWLKKKLWIKATVASFLDIDSDKILFCRHHLAHASSSFLCSPYKQAALMTVDGVGEWDTTMLGYARYSKDGADFNIFESIAFPHSLGLLYSVFTAFLGFKVNNGEYKVMGMSAYGKPRYKDKIYKMIKVAEDGSFCLDMNYFSFTYSVTTSFSKNFVKLFGLPRNSREPLFLNQNHSDPGPKLINPSQQKFFDIAASIQAVTEEVLLKIAHYLYHKTKTPKLCLGGGVALNCLANYKIFKFSPFDDIFIQPAAGDSGGALGAALYAWHCFLKKAKPTIFRNVYLGPQYSQAQVKKVLDKKKANYYYLEDKEQLLDIVVNALVDKKIVGWFKGRAEWGPRALGNRSILADPRDGKMKDIVNDKVKFREPFRPFAASVLDNYADDFFDITDIRDSIPLQYMLYTVRVKRGDIPAVTHVDGTSRIQLLKQEVNDSYYQLINKFYLATGVPLLLNTSFNLKGEPIVNSPADAYATFVDSGIDLLVIGNFLITKNKL
jgi:carbamoyltransferase